MKLHVKLAVAVLSFASITSTALATDRLVPSQYPTIQAAIDAAATSTMRVVEVAAGTYAGPIDFKGKPVVVHGAGAYGYVMSSNYNARPRAAEVMVDGNQYAVVTRRESYDDLMRLELEDPHWRDA